MIRGNWRSRAVPQGPPVLSGKEGKALTHLTNWDDVSEQSQAALLQLESVRRLAAAAASRPRCCLCFWF